MDLKSHASFSCQPTVSAVPQLSICWPSLPVKDVATVLFHGVVGAGCSTFGGMPGTRLTLRSGASGRPRFSSLRLRV